MELLGDHIPLGEGDTLGVVQAVEPLGGALATAHLGGGTLDELGGTPGEQGLPLGGVRLLEDRVQ